ncbi:membrane protein [Mycobacterium kansasii ATCC 12478]|nr:membrane protein [Mycobacterium kansasii ATCC 12478]
MAMNVSSDSQTRTRMFSRVLGPFLVIVDVTAVVRASDMANLLAQFEANSLWTWVTGAFVLLFGLVMVASHQCWRGTAAIIVSLLGWLVTLRGLLLLAFPKAFVSVADAMIGAQGVWVSLCLVFALVGLYLTYVGWAPTPSRPTQHAATARPDLPRAA